MNGCQLPYQRRPRPILLLTGAYHGELYDPEVLESEYYFARDSSDVHTEVGGHVGEDGNLVENDWIFSAIDERVYDVYSLDLISMYEIIFREMGFRVPFKKFQISVFNHLELAPS